MVAGESGPLLSHLPLEEGHVPTECVPPPGREAPAGRSLYEELKRRRILVRYMSYEGFGDGLRISVGTDVEIDRLLQELRQIV